MLALHTRFAYFPAPVTMPISVWKRRCRPHGSYFRLLPFEPTQTTKYF